MADLKLTISGENQAGGALADAKQGVEHLSESHGKLAESIAFAAEKYELYEASLEKVIEFSKEAVKLFQEQEQADRQLGLAAGGATKALLEQADAMEKSLGFDAVKTEKMQALLYRFGEAPEKIGATVKALYDYATVTGGDALQAAEHLTSSVNTGRDAFKELGLAYEKTGDKSKDLEAVTEALAKKIGGASEADKDSLAGQMRRAAAEQENMQKAFGGLMSEFLEKTQVVNSLTFAFEKLSAAMKGPDREQRVADLQAREAKAKDTIARFGAYGRGKGNMGDIVDAAEAELKAVQEGYAQIDAEDKKREGGLEAANPNAGLTAAAIEKEKEKARAAAIEKEKEKARAAAQVVKAARQEKRDTTAEEDAKDEVLRQENINAQHNAHVKELAKEAEEEQRYLDKVEQMKSEAAERGVEIAEKAAEEEQAAWDAAAEGAAKTLASKVGSVLEALAGGDKVSASDILATVLGVGGSLAGFAIGGPGGAAIGGMAGGIAGQAVRGLGKRYSFHDGGWVGEWPRHHEGTWSADEHPAVLQRGERVLTGGEVAQMGGRGAVDAAASGRGGGGGVTVNVSTFDGSSAKEYFEQAGGRALYHAVRTGRGSLVPLLGGG